MGRDELLPAFRGLKNLEQHSSYLAGRPVGVINNCTLKLMFWAPAGWRCTVLFWAALAYVKVGGGEVYELCRSQAWEIMSNTLLRWSLRPERKKRRRVRRFPERSATSLMLFKSFLLIILECVSDLNSIDILLNLERQNPACSFLACSPRCLLVIFTPSSAKFHTGNTHTHTLVFLKPTNSAAWFRAPCRCVGGPSG